ncbi:hypothetical protein [Flavobacterium sp.]|uniref:hypothetical protein n=1 Tax=Flavobacterium sp. TaxID=239 RepID=UPI00260BCC00|nr:hypothetical protein [Flavobacterium sp.]
MKTKIAQLFFTTALMLTLNFGSDIGGPTLPPKPTSGPAYKADESTRSLFCSSENNLTDVTRH